MSSVAWKYKIVIRVGSKEHVLEGEATTPASATATDLLKGLRADMDKKIPETRGGRTVSFEARRQS